MADIFNINNVAYCVSATSVNHVLRTNTHSIDTIIKDCETAACYTCGPIYLGYSSDSCPVACAASCTAYYTIVPPSRCDGCDLLIGDPVYSNINCDPAADGFYSANSCDSSGGLCENCYQVSGGVIIALTQCNSGDCTLIKTSSEPVGLCGVDSSLSAGACNEISCINRYTDGTPGSLVPGNHLYSDSGCLCDPATGPGFYKAYAGDCDSIAQCVEVEETCYIRAVQPCRDI